MVHHSFLRKVKKGPSAMMPGAIDRLMLSATQVGRRYHYVECRIKRDKSASRGGIFIERTREGRSYPKNSERCEMYCFLAAFCRS
jgi:hypothetical protein